MITINNIRYKLPNPPSKLRHKRRNVFEIIIGWIMSSHVCQICKRKEIWSVSGWLQIDHPIYKDSDGCSNVCFECKKLNPEIFENVK